MQTTWCYDGEVITPTPENYVMGAYGLSVDWWEFPFTRVTQEGITANISRTSGGYWQDHLRDKSRVTIEKKMYIDNDIEADVCVRWYSEIWKKSLGNGNTGIPEALVSDEWPC